MIAISYRDYDRYGCPNCGCDFAVAGNFISCGTSTATCEECHMEFLLLPDGVEVSNVGIGTNRTDKDGSTLFEHPRRIEHPRKGIPKHAHQWPDPRPESGGEYWHPRGIGYDLSGFVKSKKAGERLLGMVKRVLGKDEPASWLDYRPHEPKWIQFKFQESEFDLKKLEQSVNNNNGVLTYEILRRCRKIASNKGFKYYEVRLGLSQEEDETNDFWLCIKSYRNAKPTLGNLHGFLKDDLKKHPGFKVQGVYPLSKDIAESLYDLSNEPNWPIFKN